jgi:hypothetical protein
MGRSLGCAIGTIDLRNPIIHINAKTALAVIWECVLTTLDHPPEPRDLTNSHASAIEAATTSREVANT